MRTIAYAWLLAALLLAGCRPRDVPCHETESPWANLLRRDIPLTYAYVNTHYDKGTNTLVTELDENGAPLVRRITLEPDDDRHSAIIELWRTSGLKAYRGYLGGKYATVPQEPSELASLLLQRQPETEVRIELIPTGPVVIEAHDKTSELLAGRTNWYAMMTLLRGSKAGN